MSGLTSATITRNATRRTQIGHFVVESFYVFAQRIAAALFARTTSIVLITNVARTPRATARTILPIVEIYA